MASVLIVLMLSSSSWALPVLVVIRLPRLPCCSAPSSVPNLVRGEQSRAHHPGVGAAFGQRHLGSAPQRGQRAVRSLLDCAVEVKVPTPATSPRRSPRARARRRSRSRRSPPRACGAKRSNRRLASGSPASAACTRSRPETRPSLPSTSARAAVRLVAGQLGGVALERLPRAVGLDAAAVGAVAGTGRPVGAEREVPELGAQPVRAAKDAPVGDHPAAHAGAEGEHHELVPEPSMCASASAATLASLSTYTGRPKRRPSSSRSGTPARGMFTLVSTLPVA